MKRILSWRLRSASILPLIPSPGRPKMTSTPQSMSVSKRISADVRAMLSSLFRAESDGAQQCVCRLAAIQPGVLNDDGDIRFDQAGVIGVPWDRFGIVEFVEAQVPCSPRRKRQRVRSRRVALAIKDGDPDVRIAVGCVQQARCLVAGEFRRFASALARDVAFRDRPSGVADDGSLAPLHPHEMPLTPAPSVTYRV